MSKKFSARQQGAALMGMVLVIFISASTLLFSAVRPPNAIDDFDQNTYRELKAAKAALIAFATNYASYNNDDLGPGRLPCPAPWTNTVDGEERWEPYWNGCNWKYALRLPEYASLPAPYSFDFPINDYYAGRDLQFWYAISRPYRWYKQSGGSWPVVNSDTGTELTIDGDPYVAVIIAPGPALEGQDRSAAESYASNFYGATDNLEGTNYLWGSGTFISYDDDGDADSQDFNDLVIGITQSELMTPITNKVAIAIKAMLDAYHPANGDTYPTDLAEFSTAISGADAWFTNDEWDLVTNYTFVTSNDAILADPTRLGDFAEVTFDSCNIVFTLDFLSGIGRTHAITPGDQPLC